MVMSKLNKVLFMKQKDHDVKFKRFRRLGTLFIQYKHFPQHGLLYYPDVQLQNHVKKMRGVTSAL